MRPECAHGCGARQCGRKTGYWSRAGADRRERTSTKSHRAEHHWPARSADHDSPSAPGGPGAACCWRGLGGKGYTSVSPTSGPLSPHTDFPVWKRPLRKVGVHNGRLHDARHTTATVLLILGVPDVVVDSIMGWEPGGASRMRARYMHVTGTTLRKVARQVGDATWESPTAN
ncbi:hypothetical protein NGM37_36965 [Streptomyces sp. TRM76130]|nr:hypothetical protein [Streptomyces sp. TRM76130]